MVEAEKSKKAEEKADEGQKEEPIYKWMRSGLLVLMVGLLIFNQLMINDLSNKLVAIQASGALNKVAITSQSQGTVEQINTAAATSTTNEIWESIRPKGKPEIYGDELGISYDKADAAIPVLSKFDDLGSNNIQLSGEKMERYIKITNAISCEYCCGAPAITTSNGQPACGCAHSAAMRGLAKYLVDKHPEISDEKILEELSKWKVLFFPADSVKKAVALKANNIAVNYITISSNQYRGLQFKAASSSSGETLPSQVGGC